MTNKLSINDKIGIFDPMGLNLNPLTNKPFSDNYKKWGQVWSKYPTFEKADVIMETINNYQLTFIISGTGSGKTVLLPKFALHYTDYQGKIAIILPKRNITHSAATFAAETLDVELGKEVGYLYKGDRKTYNSSNKLVYMTDGILIMKFVDNLLLSDFNCIIIDEAHERKIQIDLILLFLKKLLLSGKRPDLRIIIMSATIDGKKYQDYFSGVKSKIINISGQPNYPIEIHFLDKPSNSYMVDGLKLIEKIIDKGEKHDMLFFITTSNEAFQLCKNIRPKYSKVFCVEVFSEMDPNLKKYAEMSDKFLELGNYDQKLIMATNVAESSLTIQGLKYVIDSAYELYSYFNPIYYGKILEKRLITKAQALQRRGRVGRTEKGICYHLLTELQFDELEDFPQPEILKQDITMDIIKIIQITDNNTYKEGNELLNQLMDPPYEEFRNVSYELFKIYKIIDDDNKLTKIAHTITKFSSVPINRILFLIYSFQLYCAREASIIITLIDFLKGKLNNLFYKDDTICKSGCDKSISKILKNKLINKKGDHFTFLKIFENYKNAKDKKKWASEYGIRLDILQRTEKKSNEYYYKMVNLSKIPQLSRIENINTNKKILEALKLSHKHLTTKKMQPIFSKKEIDGQISKDSVLYHFYNRRDLVNKNFIYDELVNINGTWEFNMITLI